MNLLVVASFLAIVLGHPFKQKSRPLIGLTPILFCLNNSSQITKYQLTLKNDIITKSHNPVRWDVAIRPDMLYSNVELEIIVM